MSDYKDYLKGKRKAVVRDDEMAKETKYEGGSTLLKVKGSLAEDVIKAMAPKEEKPSKEKEVDTMFKVLKMDKKGKKESKEESMEASGGSKIKEYLRKKRG